MLRQALKHRSHSQENLSGSTYTNYTHCKSSANIFNKPSKPIISTNQDNDALNYHFSKRMNYKFPTSFRVVDSSLLDKDSTKTLRRNMSSKPIMNCNGSWNGFMRRTSNEETVSGQSKIKNSRVHQSHIFDIEMREPNVIRHSKQAIYTDHGKTTQIYHLPGGVKRVPYQIKDDSRKVVDNPPIATIIKHNKDFGPLFVPKDSDDTNRNIFLGGYGKKNKNKSHVFDNLSHSNIHNHNNDINNKENCNIYQKYQGKKCKMDKKELYCNRVGIKSEDEKVFHKRREPPMEKNLFRSQLVIS